MNDDQATGTFWDHLDELRGCLIRMLIAIAILALVAFGMKETLFDIVLAPRDSSFITYRLLGVSPFSIHLMNTGLTEQFMIHMRTAVYAGVLLASPYLLYEVFRFVSPALYQNERRYAGRIVGSAYLMFIVGTLLNYFLVFPLTVRFLGTYQVSADVANMLTLQSYMDSVRAARGLLGDGPHGTHQRPPHEPIPPPRHCHHPDRGSRHHPDSRRLHAVCGGAPHLAALRTEHCHR